MQWMPIDTAPKDGKPILVYARRKNGTFRITEAANPTGEQWWAKGIGVVKPTHWMPLPPPPQAS